MIRLLIFFFCLCLSGNSHSQFIYSVRPRGFQTIKPQFTLLINFLSSLSQLERSVDYFIIKIADAPPVAPPLQLLNSPIC